MKRVVILGSTGSIGTQTLDIIQQFPKEFEVVGLAAARNEGLLDEQARRFEVKSTVLFERDGMDALVDLATLESADIVVVSVAGVIGLLPTFEAIKAGKNIALASKEVLVAAGEIVMPLLKQHGVAMTPIDSEHSAVFQCLQGYRPDQVREVILTASGGPFRGKTRDDLKDITVEQALNHPTWNMGGKITIDSATLMNKGLEMIEAKWLFGVEIDQVKVVVHPQSIVHSMVKFSDGSVLGQLGWPNMRLPILYALTYPERNPNDLKNWDPADTPNLTFERPDEDTFPALGLARRAATIGGTMPAAMNAANEEAVAAFLRGKCGFLEISTVVEKAMSEHSPALPTLQSILDADVEARALVRQTLGIPAC
ncbi:MAG: 1-deoxy-D-xylulose-5-phosphate reductoisomerase [Armatimonadetes bacterium]|nr:1-deoxy-D-xylulose-5-phosphate reductoisomerase [Armatimonadota bacterium]MBS1728417.1 1-deoxy-D-xylulose-5-phosphate reductoisomerase [Armatimonadota bacterium]